MPRGTAPLPNSSRTPQSSGDLSSVAKPTVSVRLIKSRSNRRLLEAAAEFLASHQESLVITPGHSAGEELVHLAGAPPSRENAGAQHSQGNAATHRSRG